MLHLSKDAQGNSELEVNLGNLISHDPAIMGRSTVVLNAISKQWEGALLVIKISWPTTSQASEVEFINKVMEMAKGEHRRVAKHLPWLYHTEDITPEVGSTLEAVATLFDDTQFAGGKHYVYECWVLQIIIQELLFPLRSLQNMRKVGQVFVDTICGKYTVLLLNQDTSLTPVHPVHHWLYFTPKILHCDPSPNNIMYCFTMEKNGKEKLVQKVYRVLTDYNLS